MTFPLLLRCELYGVYPPAMRDPKGEEWWAILDLNQ